MAHKWSHQARLHAIPQRIEPDRRFEVVVLGDWPGHDTANAVEKALLVVEPPVVSGCPNGQEAFDFIRSHAWRVMT